MKTWQRDEITYAEKAPLGNLGQITTGNTQAAKRPRVLWLAISHGSPQVISKAD